MTPQWSSGRRVLLDVGNGVTDRLQLRQLLVGYLGAELLLHGHRDLDHGQRIDVEVVDEALLRGDVLGLDVGDLVEDGGELFEDVVGHGQGFPSGWWSGWWTPPGRATRATLRGEHDLAGVGEAGAEPEQQHRRARLDLAGLDHAGQRDRNGRGRGVA